jgi:hypothetical protein
MLVILAESGGATAQLTVSAPQWLGWQHQQKWQQQNNDNNVETMTKKQNQQWGGVPGSTQERTWQLCSAKGQQCKANAFDTNVDISVL